MSNQLSASKIKFIQSLHQKKFRQQHQSFLVEGAKNVAELLTSNFEITQLYITESYAVKYATLLHNCRVAYEVVKTDILERIGTLQSNDAALAVVNMKENKPLIIKENEWIIALDQVRDPGNLGTILRIADWYGITKVVCSEHTAEVYNPKVISATMGSFVRVETYYCHLPEYLQNISNQVVYGAFLEGENAHRVEFGAQGGVLVMGNESNGIGDEVAACIHQKISIPQYGGAESLNVAIATAVLCDNIRRNN